VVVADAHVGDVHDGVGAVPALLPRGGLAAQRADRLVPGLARGDVDDLALGVAQRGESAAEHAAGVQAQGVVDPLGLEHGGVPVDDRGLAAVVAGPGQAHRQPVLVGLAVGVPVQGEGAHPAGGAAVVGLLEPGVGDHEPPLVEDEVADQPVAEVEDLLAELLALPAQLLQGLGEPVGGRDLGAPERADQLVLVVPGHAQGVAVADHAHGQPQHAGGVGAAVHEVADEDGGAALRVAGADGPPLPVPGERVAQGGEQLLQLLPAAVDVADDVEGAGELALVGPGALAFDDGGVDLLHALEDVDLAEPLLAQVLDALAQVAALAGDHVVAEVAVGAGPVAQAGHGLGHVQDDGGGQHVVGLGHGQEFGAGLALHVGGVHHGQQAAAQPDVHDGVQQGEGVRAGGLVVLVVADQAAAVVGGDDLGGLEVPGGEGGLARAGHADQHHESHGGHAEDPRGGVRSGLIGAHRVNTPIWVGEPVAGSWGPTGR
jgi:hypothetical protein